MYENEHELNPNFSDIPALGDTQGLENYLNNEALASQGLTPVPQTETPQENPETTTETSGFTKEQLTELVQKVDAINAQLGQSRAQQTQQPQQQPYTTQQRNAGYTAQEQQFIAAALQKGYTLDQINQVITQRRTQTPAQTDMARRIDAMEQYLRSQQYQQAQDAFVSKVSTFGDKWGLSDSDLETFANEALKHGINIAMENVDLEMVFRAVYPQQYAIRSQRMTPTNTSQIYGGTSIPEGNRANASRLEDQYVESFLRGKMPNQYGMLNKK